MQTRSYKPLILLALFGFPAFAVAAATPLDDGVKGYQNGEYAEAVKSFEHAIDAGHENGHVYYNLGNSLYRTGEFGRALAAYRRALAILPRDPDVRANLSLARKQASDRIEDEEDPVTAFLKLVYPQLEAPTMQAAFLILYILGFCLLLGAVNTGRRGLRATGLATLLAAFLWGALTYGVRPGRDGSPRFALTDEARRLHPAVIVSPEAQIYSGDGESYQVVFSLHEGAEVMSGVQRGEWAEVLLPGGRKGWLKQENIDILRP